MVYLEKRNANLALGEKQMASRSFRVFGTRTDLESVFYEFQKLNLVKYYKCGRNENKIDDITKTIYFGISLNGSHIGNQYLVIKDDKSICFDKYKHISQYLNETSVAINLGGLYDENTIVPTTVSTIWYDNKISKEIFNDLRKSLRRWRECDRDRSSNVLYQSGGSQIVKESKRSRRKKDDRIRNQGTDV